MIETNEDALSVAEEITALFLEHGNLDYDGEAVSQTQHMIQSGMQAMAEGGDMELILGAFLHDVGHLLRYKQETEAMDGFGVVNHEGLGAQYLRSKGFSERLCAMVEKHVDAKRYLVATDETYKDKLSEASLQTLMQWQGGPMNDAEIMLFEQHPYFDDIIKVRLWDEGAKETGMVMLPLEHFKKLMIEYLNDAHN